MLVVPHSPGLTIGPFTLRERLGAGSMGEVWRASSPETGEVALKLPRRLSFVRHLRREGVLLAKIDNPHVAKLIARDVESDAPWLATELVSGQSLRALCRGTITSTQATLLCDQVLDGLAAIHNAGVLHLDLKPENVVVDKSGVAKIVDLGVGRAAQAFMAELFLSASLASRDLPLAGTLAYMAPEQRKGKPVDARADLFAFGVLLHELISGKLPQPGTRLTKLRGDLTPRWDVVVAKLTHPEPEHRPASAEEARTLVAFTLHEKTVRPVARGGHDPRVLATFDEEAFAFESPWKAGMTVGACELEEPLGRGGFGEVWRARRTLAEGKEEKVAVKLALREEAHAGLKVEAEAARRTDHPGVPKVLADCTGEDPPHVVFELIEGRSLRARIHDEGVIPFDEALDILEGVFAVVGACHAAGVVHRDLKPEHFLIGEPDTRGHRHVWLIDFGLAWLAGQKEIEASIATGDARGGTFDYMAPEVKHGQDSGASGDLYALGVVLFEVIADDLPRGPQRLSTLRRGVPQEVDDLAVALMNHDPSRRPSLEQALASLRSARGPRPEVRVYRSKPEALAYRVFVWTLKIVIALALLGALVFGIALLRACFL